MSGPQSEAPKTRGKRSEVKHTHTHTERDREGGKEREVSCLNPTPWITVRINPTCIKTAEAILQSSCKHNSCPSIVRLLISVELKRSCDFH